MHTYMWRSQQGAAPGDSERERGAGAAGGCENGPKASAMTSNAGSDMSIEKLEEEMMLMELADGGVLPKASANV